MFYNLRERAKRRWFATWCRGVLMTPPIAARSGGVTIVSKVCHLDVMMYLLAVKSLLLNLGEADVAILNDGTLTPEDINVLKAHLSPSEIVHVNDITYGRGLRGPNWEILLYISDCVEDHYIIQLDSDTLTLSQIPEVIQSIQENRSFTLGTGMGKEILSMEQFCRTLEGINDDHVQVIAEQNFGKLQDYKDRKYVRGCAGFTGFAKGSFSRPSAEGFFREMKEAINGVWLRRGSFQVASNFIIANSPQSWILPSPKYSNFSPSIPYEESAFLHFIGPERFKGGVYVRNGRAIVNRLNEQLQ